MVHKVNKVYRFVNTFDLTFKLFFFFIYCKGPAGRAGEYGMLGDRGLPVHDEMKSLKLLLFFISFILGRSYYPNW